MSSYNNPECYNSPFYPRKTTNSTAPDSILNATSPFNWLLSPFSNVDALSPETTMSCSLSSPPEQYGNTTGHREHTFSPSLNHISSPTFSPSIFSPEPGARNTASGNHDQSQHTDAFSLFEDDNEHMLLSSITMATSSRSRTRSNTKSNTLANAVSSYHPSTNIIQHDGNSNGSTSDSNSDMNSTSSLQVHSGRSRKEAVISSDDDHHMGGNKKPSNNTVPLGHASRRKTNSKDTINNISVEPLATSQHSLSVRAARRARKQAVISNNNNNNNINTLTIPVVPNTTTMINKRPSFVTPDTVNISSSVHNHVNNNKHSSTAETLTPRRLSIDSQQHHHTMQLLQKHEEVVYLDNNINNNTNNRHVTHSPSPSSSDIENNSDNTNNIHVIVPTIRTHQSQGKSALNLQTLSHNAITASTATTGINNTTQQQQTTCNCKKSRCLKLYCDCFAILNFCNPAFCKCAQCSNNPQHEETRNTAIRLTKERNAYAFQLKISEKEEHVAGCHCKNSHCLKKYCECFNGSALCGSNCKCQSCKNFAGSNELLKVKNSTSTTSTTMAAMNPSNVNVITPSGSNTISHSNSQGHSSSSSSSMVSYTGKRRRESPSSSITASYTSPAPHNNNTNNNAAKLVTPINNHTNSHSTSFIGSSSTRSGKKQQQQLPPHHHHHDSASYYITTDHTTQQQQQQQQKKKKVKFAHVMQTYPFFGEQLPETPKIIALKCLDFLSGKDIYSMSVVSSLWNRAAMDDALWE